jgi:hypothetical protein
MQYKRTVKLNKRDNNNYDIIISSIVKDSYFSCIKIQRNQFFFL